MRTILDAEDKELKILEEFKNASVEKQRFLVHAKKIHLASRSVKYENDEKLCYFFETLTPRFGTKGFIQRKATHGFTLDKKTKKLKVWYGHSLLKTPTSFMSAIFKDMKMEWVNAMSENLQRLMTRMLMEKIMKGKITNPRDYMKSYVKTHLRIKVSPENYYKLFSKNYSEDYTQMSLTPGFLNEVLRCSKNPEWVVQNYRKAEIFQNNSLKQEIINECKILGKKVDWSWSSTRLNEEHTKMSREIRGLELEYIEDKTVEYKNMPELPEGWELINNQKRLFIEGSEQDHCVFQYWSNVERKDYFILSVKQGKGKITAAIQKKRRGFFDEPVAVDAKGQPVKQDEFELGQCFGLRNDNCADDLKASPETKKAIADWIAKPEIQQFLKSQKEKSTHMVVTEEMIEMMNQPGYVA